MRSGSVSRSGSDSRRSQIWFPLVIASMPSSFSSSRMSFVTPKPAAEFSTFPTTKSMPIEETMSGTSSRTAFRPGAP
jgi:hypothetical protein